MNTIINIEELDGGGGYVAVVKDMRTGSSKELVFKGSALNESINLFLRIKWSIFCHRAKHYANILWIGIRYLLGSIFSTLAMISIMCDIEDDSMFWYFIAFKMSFLLWLELAVWSFTAVSYKTILKHNKEVFSEMYKDIKGLFI